MDRRHELRQQLAMDMVLSSGAIAMTRNLCAHGMYFDMPQDQLIDRWVRVEFDCPGLRFTALGEVLRIEQCAHTQGVAMRFHHLQVHAIS
jgi:hypothetical protein